MLRHIRPSRKIGSILKWEGIVIVPIGAVLAVLVFEQMFIVHDSGSSGGMVWPLLKTALCGCALGLAAAILLIQLVRRYWVPDFLHGVMFLTVVLATFSASNYLAHESGLVAVTVLGIILANQKAAPINHVIEFKEHLRVFLISCLFIVLVSRLDPNSLFEMGWQGVLFLAVLILVVRPVSVFLSTLRTDTTIPDTITIDADNVVVALGGTLEGVKLVIADNRKNIIIKNGTIITDGVAISIGANVSHVAINDITITTSTGNLDVGISVGAGSDSICVLNSVIHNTNQAGILFDSVDKCCVEGCTVHDANLTSTDVAGGGIVFMNTTNCTVCQTYVSSTNIRGILIEGGVSNIHNKLLTCVTSENSGIGIEINAQKTMVEGCIARCNGSHGFAFDGSAHGVDSTMNNLTDCISEYNTGSGFYCGADTNGNIVESCKSICNTGTGFYDLSSTGTNFYLNNVSGNNTPNYSGIDYNTFDNVNLQ